MKQEKNPRILIEESLKDLNALYADCKKTKKAIDTIYINIEIAKAYVVTKSVKIDEVKGAKIINIESGKKMIINLDSLQNSMDCCEDLIAVLTDSMNIVQNISIDLTRIEMNVKEVEDDC